MDKMKRTILIIFFIAMFTGCERESFIEPNSDTQPLMAPANLRVYGASDGRVGIEWLADASVNLLTYNIYRSDNDTLDFRLIANTPDQFFVDENLNYDDKYYYRVTAMDRLKRESEPSSTVSATPKNIYKPLPPYDVEINARNWYDKRSIYLSWEPSFDTDIDSYFIYRDIIDDFTPGDSNLIGSTKAVSFEDTSNLEFYQLYFYKIIAVDKGGLKSVPTNDIGDKILEKVKAIFPANDSTITFFNNFRIQGINSAADYKLVLQTNEIYGEIWNSRFSFDKINEVINIEFNPIRIELFKKYYWRIFTYTNSSEPNSISDIYSFTLTE